MTLIERHKLTLL
jgi:Zn finger protein HypA/HybF involved in hydrogenase expression